MLIWVSCINECFCTGPVAWFTKPPFIKQCSKVWACTLRWHQQVKLQPETRTFRTPNIILYCSSFSILYVYNCRYFYLHYLANVWLQCQTISWQSSNQSKESQLFEPLCWLTDQTTGDVTNYLSLNPIRCWFTYGDVLNIH